MDMHIFTLIYLTVKRYIYIYNAYIYAYKQIFVNYINEQNLFLMYACNVYQIFNEIML